MKALADIIPDQIVKAICNTLIHSLWEGLILAVLTAVTIVLTKKAKADLRYKLLTGYMLLFAGCIALTFFLQLDHYGHSAAKGDQGITGVLKGSFIAGNGAFVLDNGNIFSAGYDYLNSRSSLVVLIWFLVVWIKYVRFAGGLYHIYGLKRRQLLPAGRYWEEKVAELADALGIKNKVVLLQSGLAKVPITLGHLKPLILVPVGLLTNLSASEVEAILLHELSHIKRKDYMVNILQNILEIIFFFNPAVLWLSALIKAERENCCDDMVISKTSDKATYIQALLSCQEYNSTNYDLAMGLSGKKTSLIGRVKRIVSNNNQTLNVMEKGFLTFSIVTALLITLTVSSTDAKSVNKALVASGKVLAAPFRSVVREPAQEVQRASSVKSKGADTLVKAKKNRVKADVNGKQLEFVLLNGRATDLYVDGKKIAADHIADYQKEIDGILVRAKEAKIRAAEERKRAKLAAERGAEAAERARLAAESAAKAQNRAAATADRAKLAAERAAQGVERAKLAAEDADRARERADEAGKRAKEAAENGAKARERAKQAAENSVKAKERAAKAQADALDIQNRILTDLIQEGVIKDQSNLSYKLSSEELIVNGKKQPDALQRKLSEKYATGKSWIMNVEYSPSTSGKPSNYNWIAN